MKTIRFPNLLIITYLFYRRRYCFTYNLALFKCPAVVYMYTCTSQRWRNQIKHNYYEVFSSDVNGVCEIVQRYQKLYLTENVNLQ